DSVEEISDGDLSAITPVLVEPCKMVLVVRAGPKTTNGKIAAHHATIACYRALERRNAKLLRHWERTGQAKIALKGTSENQLLELEAIAKRLNLCARLVRDPGLTEVAEDTATVLGIGPAPVALVNEVTGKLRLL
ncbi:peptidyl-tRNA hydrolase II, partial [Thelephora ganbajun]